MEVRQWCKGLEPQDVLSWFDKLSQIPHGTGNLEQISDAVLGWLKDLGLRAVKDEWCNVKGFMDATPGCEDRRTLLLTAHLDMVCAKENDSQHDFLRDPIPVYLADDGDTITADGTTLGADDGMGVAYILALLGDKTVEHGPIEVILTADEETDMNGALNLDYSDLKASVVVCLDGDPISVAGAGQLDTRACIAFETEDAPEGMTFYKLTVSGLLGGHSGLEAMKERGNAAMILTRALVALEKDAQARLCSVTSGNDSSTAFAYHAEAVFAVAAEKEQAMKAVIAAVQAEIANELLLRDEGVTLTVEKCAAAKLIKAEGVKKFFDFMMLVPEGVCSRNMSAPTLMESSVNTGVIRTEEDAFIILSTIRSGVKSRKYVLYERIVRLAALIGAELTVDCDLPEWPRRLPAEIEALCVETFPNCPIIIDEATNECGVFCDNLPGAGVVSLQCPYKGAHSTNECVSLKDVGLYYGYFKDFVKRLK